MGNVKGWAIDLKAVYGDYWADRARFHMSEDLWESPEEDLAGLLYGIAEVGMAREVGRLAVFRNKAKPELVLNLPELLCWYLYDDAVQFGKGGLLVVHRFRDRGSRFEVVPWVLYPEALCFAPVDSLPQSFYGVRHAGGTKFRFTDTEEKGSAGTVVDVKDLRWRSAESRRRALLDLLLPRFGRPKP